MTVRNPNKRIGIYYDSIEARVFYEGQRFNSIQLTRFYQGHKNTTTLNAVFKGQNLVLLGNKEASKFNEEKSSGTFSIDMKLYLRIRFKVSVFKSPKFKPKIECDLKVPLDSNGGSSGSFEATKCKLDW
ncbi:unnamed protein product [Ilex paraguariensis]|uniref:Late embryogenesis abundant protein LEA-2 subgroup domain-containing protein n=1 Tax=Ilex paraguariensis TaxID=185542 RepID=A0ABC8UN20_9AQUA